MTPVGNAGKLFSDWSLPSGQRKAGSRGQVSAHDHTRTATCTHAAGGKAANDSLCRVQVTAGRRKDVCIQGTGNHEAPTNAERKGPRNPFARLKIGRQKP